MANSVTFPVGLGGSGITIDDSSNPGVGLGNGGHKTLFVPALSQTVVMAQTAVTYATNTSGYMATTLGYRDAASASATLAQNWATQMGTPVSGGEYSAKYWAGQAALGAEVTFTDTTAMVKGSADATKKVRMEVDGLTTGTTRVLTVQDRDGTVALLDDTGLKLLASITPTASAAAVDFLNVFSSTYDDYMILIDGISCFSGNGTLAIRFANAGVVDSAANYKYTTNWTTSAGSGNGGTAQGHYIISPSGGGYFAFGVDVTARIHIHNANSTTTKIMRAEVYPSNGASAPLMSHAIYTSTSSISGFRLFDSSAAAVFAAKGRIRVYGFKKD